MELVLVGTPGSRTLNSSETDEYEITLSRLTPAARSERLEGFAPEVCSGNTTNSPPGTSSGRRSRATCAGSASPNRGESVSFVDLAGSSLRNTMFVTYEKV